MKKKPVMTNEEYARRRAALIPEAEKICSRAQVLHNGQRGAKWVQLFLKVMDRLWLLEMLKDQQNRIAIELAHINNRITAVNGDLEKAA